MYSFSDFALLQSSVHSEWAWKMASSLESRLRYTPSDVLEPFPFPQDYSTLESLGEKYDLLRSAFMKEEGIGLTQTYNLYHSNECTKSDVVNLRDLHLQIDDAVAAAYGWADIDLRHDFYSVPYLPENDRVRFTICEEARLEILRRLSQLNRERYAAEELEAMETTGDRIASTLSRKRVTRTKRVSLDVQADLF
ncbi:hypothetical protein WJ71_09560 [Burkholderia ubonensis]|nr:hypothetical protein WJ71_09560 [Burkholderia ubonensis]